MKNKILNFLTNNASITIECENDLAVVKITASYKMFFGDAYLCRCNYKSENNFKDLCDKANNILADKILFAQEILTQIKNEMKN